VAVWPARAAAIGVRVGLVPTEAPMLTRTALASACLPASVPPVISQAPVGRRAAEGRKRIRAGSLTSSFHGWLAEGWLRRILAMPPAATSAAPVCAEGLS
jgi:hypothetical protein